MFRCRQYFCAKGQFSGAEIAPSHNKLFLCAVQKKTCFHIERLHNSWEQCGKNCQCWQRLVGLFTLQVTLVNKLQPLFGMLKIPKVQNVNKRFYFFIQRWSSHSGFVVSILDVGLRHIFIVSPCQLQFLFWLLNCYIVHIYSRLLYILHKLFL